MAYKYYCRNGVSVTLTLNLPSLTLFIDILCFTTMLNIFRQNNVLHLRVRRTCVACAAILIVLHFTATPMNFTKYVNSKRSYE